MAGKSCHILRPVPIEHEYDPVIYKDAHYVTSYPEFAAAMAQPNPPFPIARDVIEGYFDPSPAPAYKRMADLLEEVYKNPPRDEPMGPGLTPPLQPAQVRALAGYTCCTATSGNPNGCLPSARRWPTLPAHLRLCGQSLYPAGGDPAHGSAHPAICKIKLFFRRAAVRPLQMGACHV